MPTPTIRIVGADATDLTAVTAAVAGNIPAQPPADWFARRDLPADTPLTFTEDGQVYGLLAPRNIPHIGMPGRGQTAPTSASDYAYFHLGQVRCDDGSMVNTGPITMGTGHADTHPSVTAASATAHYDNTGTAIADVVAWDTPAGVMCAGAARPGLTAAQIREAMASKPSGDWRPIRGHHEMVGALLVNTPGFPAPRPIAASGALQPLVAGGAPAPRITVTPTTPTTEVPVPQQPTSDGFTADQAVHVDLAGQTPVGLVASVDGDRALVTVDVPLTALSDAGPEGRVLLASAQRERVRDTEIAGLRDQIAALTASIEQDRADRSDQAALDAVPPPAQA